MKAKHVLFIALSFLLLTACGSNKDEKKNEAQAAAKDSVVAEEKLPSLEKEFADTLNLKPVDEAVLLKFNFQKGRTYNYAMTFDINQKKRRSIQGKHYEMEL